MPWNTTSLPSDKERLRTVLGIPVERQWLDILQQSMDRITRDSEDSIFTAQTLLDEWESAKGASSLLQRSENYALIRADVLEWEAGQRGAGYEIRLYEIKHELATMLLIQPPETIGANSGGTLYRS